MRSFMIALAAVGLLVASLVSAEAAAPKVGRGSLAAQPIVRTLATGQQAQGKLAVVNAQSKFLELQTKDGLLRVPVTGKLKVQNGQNGTPHDASFGEVQSLARKLIVVIVIRTPDTIIVVIIRA